jgi:hypothetical protein
LESFFVRRIKKRQSKEPEDRTAIHPSVVTAGDGDFRLADADGWREMETLGAIVGDFARSAWVFVGHRVGASEIRKEGSGGKAGKVVHVDTTDVVAAITV